MREAKRRGAHLVHFPEGSLSGYAGREFASFAGYDWARLRTATEAVMTLAGEMGLWVVLGSSHPLSGAHKPHNSLYVIDARGRLVDRYDKMFCVGDARENTDDLKNYSSGDHFVTFRVRGVLCGLLICHDFRYPELYREYKRRGVQLMLHSYHNGNSPQPEHGKRGNIWDYSVTAASQAYAAANYLWISANNTSRRHSNWPSFWVRPDGRITGRLIQHRSGVLISTLDPKETFFDASQHWRSRAMRGIYHSGTLVRDARSRDRREL